MSPLTTLFNIVLEVLTNAIRQDKQTKGIHFGKEDIKLSLFANDMIDQNYALKGAASSASLCHLIADTGHCLLDY